MDDPASSSRTSTRTTGRKRSIGATEGGKDIIASKRPALSSAFSNHVSQSSLSRQLLSAQSQISDLQATLHEKQGVIDRLEADRRWLASKEEEQRSAREAETKQFSEEREQLDEDLSDTRHRLADLENKHADLQDAHSALSHMSQREISALKSELASQVHETALLETQLADAQALAATRQDTITELEARDESDMSATGIHSLSTGPDTEENWKVIREELHRQSAYLRTLEATNARLNGEVDRLRQRAEVLEVLREEKLDLERRVRCTEDLRRRVGELEGELASEQAERISERQIAENAEKPSKMPVAITRQLASVQTAHALLLDENGQLKATLRTFETELADAIAQQDKSAEEIAALKTGYKQAWAAASRRERDAKLMEAEVGFLKALVASYKAEASCAAGGDLPTPATTDAQTQLEQRVVHLEELLVGYKTSNAALEQDIQRLMREGGPVAQKGRQEWDALVKRQEEAIAEKTALESTLKETEATCRTYEDKVENLEQTLFELRGDIGAGYHVPPGTRVLSLRQNPAQEWADTRKEVLNRLKGENEALLRRLRELEEGGVRAQGAPDGERFVPRESWDAVTQEKKDLEEAVRQKEKRLLRLQQVFTAKSTEFREAIAAILGLKLAFYPNGQVRVTSQYDLSASFVFQPTKNTEGARMQLIGQGEGGPQELPQLMRYWVEQEQCIPGFLAMVTLDCYEKSKSEQEEMG